jgi:serine/threonine-protein kinase HipA
VDIEVALARVTSMAEALPDHASDLARSLCDEGMDHPILLQLPTLLADSARKKGCRLVQHRAHED